MYYRAKEEEESAMLEHVADSEIYGQTVVERISFHFIIMIIFISARVFVPSCSRL
jgi:hypothetical protein